MAMQRQWPALPSADPEQLRIWAEQITKLLRSGDIATGADIDGLDAIFLTPAEGDAAYVNISGDTMTGLLLNTVGLVVGFTAQLATELTGSPNTPISQVAGIAAGDSMVGAFRFSNGATPPRFILAKSRGTTIGAQAAVQSGDVIGEIAASGSDGTNFAEGAAISFVVDATPGTNDMPTAIVFSTSPDASDTPVEGWRVTSEQNLKGIGQGYFAGATLIDGATINWNLNTQQCATVTLGGNRTLAAPTNMKNGATYILLIKQDGTGSRTLAWNAAYKFPGGTDPVLSTGANAVDLLTCYSDGSSMYCSCAKNFS